MEFYIFFRENVLCCVGAHLHLIRSPHHDKGKLHGIAVHGW